MNILSWNCRGLGNPQTVGELCRLVKDKRPAMIFLMETKLRKSRMELVRIKIGFPNMMVVDSIGRSGGLALFKEREGWS
jgi:exonuclease III